MTFKLYDGANSSSVVWSETQKLSVYQGRFQALLGSSSTAKVSALAVAIKNADDLYLGISLETSGGPVSLANRQRFLPVPYATWSTSAAKFTVADTLNVSGNTTLSGTVAAKSTLAVAGKSTLTGAVDAKSTLGVAGKTTLNGDVDVTGTKKLSFGSLSCSN